MKRIGLLVAALWTLGSLPAAASQFSINFCPGGAGCPAGVTQASLTFIEDLSTPLDPNDYILDIVIKGTGSAPYYVDELSFSTPAPTPAGYESQPTLLSAPSVGNPWTVFYDGISGSSSSCTTNTFNSQSVCIQSGPSNPANFGAPLQNQTLEWKLSVDLAAGYLLQQGTQVNLRAQFLNMDGSNAGILSPDGGGLNMPEPTTISLLGAGIAALVFGKRRSSARA